MAVARIAEPATRSIPEYKRAERATFRRIAWRFVPLLTLCFLVNYIDRTNVGFAALSMNRDLGLSDVAFGWGAGVLFFGYCLFEVPSSLVQYRVGARLWLSRIMITWGLLSAATALSVGPKSFYGLRFLLGVAEAGFNPGVMFFFMAWFPSRYQGRILAWFQMAIPLSAVVAGPLSVGILSLNGTWGLRGWQWLFIVEGLPAIILGVAVLLVLKERPDQAGWLDRGEQAMVTAAIEAEPRRDASHSFGAVLRDPRVLLLAAIQLCFTLGAYAVGIWLPLILKQHHMTLTQIGLASAVPYALGCLATILWATASDRSGKRILNLAATCCLATIGLLISVWFHDAAISLLGLTLAIIGVTSTRGIFWSIPPQILQGRGAAGGLAFISSVGAFGGFLGPLTMGWLKHATGSFTTGLGVLAFIVGLSGILSLMLPTVNARYGGKATKARR
ncbi:MFS transporter [Lichenicola cladoniae]|nr:MFS transporter [Lichenicola cladoniae]